jgi:hypothetical protein
MGSDKHTSPEGRPSCRPFSAPSPAGDGAPLAADWVL